MVAGGEPDDMAVNNPPGTPRRRGGPPLDLAKSALVARVNISAKNPSESIANCRAPCYGIGVIAVPVEKSLT